MKDIKRLRKQLLGNWKASSDDVFNAYSKILDHIFNEPCNNMKHMSFGSFGRIVNNNKISNETLLNLVFHVINRAELLDMKYEFIDDNEMCYPLTLEIVKEAKLSGLLYHPETGYPVRSYHEKVFMYFIPSQKLLDLKNGSL